MTTRPIQVKLASLVTNPVSSGVSLFVNLSAFCILCLFSVTALSGLPTLAKSHQDNQQQAEVSQQPTDESHSQAAANEKQGEITPQQANDQLLAKTGDNFFPPRTSTTDEIKQEDVTRRPLVYWRSWANQRLPFGRILGLLIIVSLTINYFIEPKILEAGLIYRQKWLRCFSIGVLLFTFGMIGAGIMSRMGLFAPVGVLLIATIQLSALIGLTIGAHAIGDTTLKLSGLNNKFPKPWLKTLSKFTVGCLLLSLFLLLPGVGRLPRMGTRMLALVAAAGAGSIFLALRSPKTKVEYEL
jgi:hypothetical protein